MSDIERQYLALLREALERGEPHTDRTGVGTRSLFVRGLWHDMSSGEFPLLTTRRMSVRVVSEELRWVLLGRTDTGWLRERGVTVWDEWATDEACRRRGRDAGQLGPTYGSMLRAYPAGDAMLLEGDPSEVTGWELAGQGNHRCDQLEQLVADLRERPGSRRNVVTFWHPLWARRVDVPPCLLTLQLRGHELSERDRRPGLSMHASFRSSDLFLGLPHDLAWCALLLRLLCASCSREPRELALTLCDAHLYDSHREQAAEQLAREPQPLPAVQLRYETMTEWTVTLTGYDPHPRIEAPVAV